MAARPVEWVLVIFYGVSAHRATYGRLDGDGRNDRYTKDYIQLSRRDEFLRILHRLFPTTARGVRTELLYQWPRGNAPGALDFSSDRWHLKWETRRGAPRAWKMVLEPSDATAETIPGDPSHQDAASAEEEFNLLTDRGAGQPYLVATRLRDEPNVLHLRAYLAKPSERYAWADLGRTPQAVADLAAATSDRRHTGWSPILDSGGVLPTGTIAASLSRLPASPDPRAVFESLDAEAGRALARYLRDPGRGLFFDPTLNHNAWTQPAPLADGLAKTAAELVALLDARFPAIPEGDAIAETLEADPAVVAAFRARIEGGSFDVPDSTATVKVRGSAQKAFADSVKTNYGHRCAITGIASRDFLVASHIVPWSEDQTIRLDPSNGICLSLLMDRAFEKGYVLIQDDRTVRVDWEKVGLDNELRGWLEPYDGRSLRVPAEAPPKPEYLRRRRALVTPAE